MFLKYFLNSAYTFCWSPMPDVLYVHVDDESELYCLHQYSLLDVRQGQTEAQAVDLTKNVYKLK